MGGLQSHEGGETIATICRHGLRRVRDIRYTDEIDRDGLHGLLFGARIGDRSLQRIDFLRLDPSTQTAESTVVIRPASGLIALAGRLG